MFCPHSPQSSQYIFFNNLLNNAEFCISKGGSKCECTDALIVYKFKSRKNKQQNTLLKQVHEELHRFKR